MQKTEMTRENLIAFAMKRIDAKVRHYVREGRIRECDAEDVGQEVIVTVLEKLNEYNEKHDACEKTFINSVVKNAFRFYFSNRRLLKNQTCSDIDALSEEEEPKTNDVSGGELSELDRIYLKLDLAAVREQLSENQQEVFDLMGSHSITDMAKVLEVSVGTIFNRIEEIRLIAQPLLEP
ncbi:MAG: sigma-70 family RNA polymerase sigma factor [Thermoguttaceae bacterium]|nr:sigma-70 family RNA polymerase sigma factor [Thermoguttaceae bacterium]